MGHQICTPADLNLRRLRIRPRLSSQNPSLEDLVKLNGDCRFQLDVHEASRVVDEPTIGGLRRDQPPGSCVERRVARMAVASGRWLQAISQSRESCESYLASGGQRAVAASRQRIAP